MLHTGLYSQLVAMEVPVGGDIGDEVSVERHYGFLSWDERGQEEIYKDIKRLTRRCRSIR